MTRRDVLLLALAALIVAGGLVASGGAGSTGTDARALAVVRDLAPDYTRWAAPAWTPGGAMESLFFALQAALGAGVIAYLLGYRRGRAAARRDEGALPTALEADLPVATQKGKGGTGSGLGDGGGSGTDGP